MLNRDFYIEQIRPFMDKPIIKVITGIRRCGKSSILILVKNELIQKSNSEKNIIYINFESMKYSDIDSGKALYKFVKDKINFGEKTYLLFDEIQEVIGWEKAINSFMVDFDVDIYIIGSNSKLLSSELSTFLTGRYIEISVQTLSFKEFLNFKKERNMIEKFDIKDELKEYIRYGGFPTIHTGEYTYDEAYSIINDIYASAILRDTVQRHNIRNIDLLEKIVKYVFDNIGNIFSAKKVADFFKNQQRKVDVNTVYNYLSALESAFIIYRVNRYDLKGKEILKTNEKFYLADPSLKYGLMGFKDQDISGVLENIVYLELRRRGYKVFVGKLGDKEVDFVAEKRDQKLYVQVAYKLASKETIDRELAPLLGINDNYPKYVVTMDDLWISNVEGVKHIHLANFLLLNDFK